MEKSCIWNFKIKKQDRELPKSWEDFCEMFPIKDGECFIDEISEISFANENYDRRKNSDRNVLPDRATAEAVLALCQLVHLRNCYNGDWKPSYEEDDCYYFIDFIHKIPVPGFAYTSASILYFKNPEIRDEFLRNFRPLIEKIKPLYGINEGGEE